jgi:hypothetical protein
MWTQLESFVGKSLRTIEKLDWSWSFRFDAPLLISTEAPWRFIKERRVIVTDGDDGQRFGLPAPVDASACVLSSLPAPKVHSVVLDEETGDLRIYFAADVYLEFLQLSGGYEAWRARTGEGEIICCGGGETVFAQI